MANLKRFRSPLPFLSLAALALAVLILVPRGGDRPGGDSRGVDECQGLPPEVCEPRSSDETPNLSRTMASPGSPETVLAMDQVCVDVGYLCAEVEQEGALRLLRWPKETERIRVLVPLPTGVDPSMARALQRAAIRGIQAWQGHPIQLSVRTRFSEGTADFSVEWARTVQDGRLGRAQIEWRKEGGRVQLDIVGFTIATHDPGDPTRVLTPDQVELVAAHEMGHVLGLPHSDDPLDVMFPTNTATRLTVRDFRTLEALYALANGAVIERRRP